MNYEARLSPASLALLRTIAGLGAVAFGAGLIAAPDRAWTALLMAGFLVTCFALAGLVFVAMQYGVGAGWSISFRRVPEAMVAVLPFGAAAVLLALIFHPYAWASMHFTGFKAVWLNRPRS